MAWNDNEWQPYVGVNQRIAQAVKAAAQLARKQGREPAPIKLSSRNITTTFWGNAWCDNLNAYSDYANRLPRGATYVRNGSVVDLVVKPLRIEALVAGSSTYTIDIQIKALADTVWASIRNDCSASIDSLLDLLAGRFSEGVMQRLTRQKDGLFPAPKEIKMSCSCPDWSNCCKHLAAVMYGVGARLDSQPELLFLLRDVDHQELVSQAVDAGNLETQLNAGDRSLADADLGEIVGIELDSIPAAPTRRTRKRDDKKQSSSSSRARGSLKTKRPDRSRMKTGKPRR
jgi:uncharacterized Zn finger protein